jgi:hypothetical protein
MGKICFSSLFMLLFCCFTLSVFSNDDIALHTNDFVFGGTDRILVRSLIGISETLLVNSVVLGFNVVSGVPWAIPNAKSIQNNFTGIWEWERVDGFIVNNFGHPLQGAMYFASGRVNRFGFYESILFNVFGSFTWESIFESNIASMNDFVVTTIASSSTGEMFYRLYLEALSQGIPAPIAFLINPVAGFHQLVTGQKPPNYGKSLHSFQTHIGAGYTHADYSMTESAEDTFLRSYYTDLGFNVVYGNPFEQDSLIPYKHFELSGSFGWNFENYMDIRFISDGYLFSFSPVYTEENRMSTGLSLHYDFFSKGDPDMENPSSMELFSNGLDWSIKYQHLFSEENKFELKYHLGVSFMGASRFFNTDIMLKLNYFGAGFNSKLYLKLVNSKIGTFEINGLSYILWNFPGIHTRPDLAVNKGVILWLFNDTTYSYQFTEHISLGITLSIAYEWKYFNNFPNTLESDKAIKIFTTWSM